MSDFWDVRAVLRELQMSLGIDKSDHFDFSGSTKVKLKTNRSSWEALEGVRCAHFQGKKCQSSLRKEG